MGAETKAIIYGKPPSKSNCYRVITIKGHGSLCKTKALTDYEKSFYIQLPAEYRNLNIDKFFEFEINAYFESMRNDLDNSLKCVLDCLQKTNTIKNDNLCVKITAQKFVDKENPRIEFVIKPIN